MVSIRLCPLLRDRVPNIKRAPPRGQAIKILFIIEKIKRKNMIVILTAISMENPPESITTIIVLMQMIAR